MRATLMYGAGDVRVEDVPDARLFDATDALVRVTRAAICGSDLWPYKSMPATGTGRPMGHEFLGVIEDTGSQVSALKTGDLVVAPFLVLTNPSRRVGYTPDTHFLYRVHDKGSLAGNLTPEKALHSACKGRRTHALIDFILRSNGASPAQLRRRELLLQEYDFLAALYSGKIGKAATLYARLARRHWKTRELVKETGRMIAVRVLGPARFLKLKG